MTAEGRVGDVIGSISVPCGVITGSLTPARVTGGEIMDGWPITPGAATEYCWLSGNIGGCTTCTRDRGNGVM